MVLFGTPVECDQKLAAVTSWKKMGKNEKSESEEQSVPSVPETPRQML